MSALGKDMRRRLESGVHVCTCVHACTRACVCNLYSPIIAHHMEDLAGLCAQSRVSLYVCLLCGHIVIILC